MKRMVSGFLTLVLALTLAACGPAAGQGGNGPLPGPEESVPAAPGPETPPVGRPEDLTEPSGGKVLVAVFSATGNTLPIAQSAADILGADLYEILPETPYTPADLNYNSDCRANREQNDDRARPAISEGVENMADYDTVLIGYPIWHGRPPRIIYTFLESYDFSGKTILPFCTSGSSPYSDAGIRELVGGDTVWLTGRRFAAGTARDDIAAWLEAAGLPPERGENTISVQVNGQILLADLADNSSAQALQELLANGPLTLAMSDYGDMEKVGPLGAELPRNDGQLAALPGDIILYQGDRFVIYYGQNTWNFTRLGKLRDADATELRALLGPSDVSVTLSQN